MLYYLFDWLDRAFDFPGAGVFQYISFRAAMSVITSLVIMLIFGKPFIKFLKKKQIGETVRDLDLDGQKAKEGTPTMGGLLILAAIVIPTLLFAKLDNIYVLIMLGTTIWLGLVGFIDDYIKVFRRNKKGLPGMYKVIGQVSLGLAVALLIMFHPDITVRKTMELEGDKVTATTQVEPNVNVAENSKKSVIVYSGENIKSTKTTIPFVKNNELDYAKIITWMGDWTNKWVWLVYAIIVIFIITAVSNAANLTDGIDGLATGVAAVNGSALAVLAWVSGNIIFANYLNIMYLPNIGELTIFITAYMGATMGFLWFNTHPAEIFMGDTGSLALGGIIAVFAILLRKELLLIILCGIYLVEDLSVIIQTVGCKLYRRKHKLPIGVAVPIEKRPFLMTPLHHHFQKKGIPEEKIVQRFVIVAILLAVVSIVTLKLR
ncbi:MAG: phospho-N-acetylmuramoyl-pentapeptide-transferase [Bacteroidales bacterium]|jgi:phospho-N-acetylmuramoyl-pentapeptide-transferase|nr:phospho-N-acetylmuramoyl-pentapeptide-transferase [Bacteroidales bacterium]